MTATHNTPHADLPRQLGRLAMRLRVASHCGDTAGAEQAAADMDALVCRVDAAEWADVYRATLADNRRG
jgi:hypothetical protein